MVPCNKMELMIVAASRLLEDGKLVTVGTGAPCAATMLAQKRQAPNLVMFFEAGGVAPLLPTMPVSVGDSRTYYKGVMATSMADVMETCQRGLMDYAFLGGAQIDPYGNLNSTHIGGDHAKPKVRLPGSGGACDLASFCWKVITITNHDRRRFVPKLDFLTTPGYLTGPGAREAAGLLPGAGPFRVVTDLAILGYHDQSKRMEVISLHPGVTLEQARDQTGFELGVREPLGQTPPPTAEELAILRDQIDPHRYLIGRS
ncbi:MAG TPA: CoA-transferase [Gemmatales bacterium]|nr:CoA-transferase [Gemmatales bacterium]